MCVEICRARIAILMMGGGGHYIRDTLNAQQYRRRMPQVIEIIPTWQYWDILQ